jgi:spore coat protein CotH
MFHLTSTLSRRIAPMAIAATMLAGACGSSATADPDVGVAPAESAVAQATDEAADGTEATTGFFDSSIVHDLELSFDQDDYDEMIETYETSGEKDWIEASVLVDGTTFDNVGVRLKGNSSLFSLTTETAGNPEDLPWLISLDKYKDDQNHFGIHDIVIRSNSTETSLNEAVALELLGLTGLATEDPVATTFRVNGGDTELRLAIEHPDEVWEQDNFDADTAALYKADSEGDYSYRGTDPEAYEDVFNQKVGDDDLEPLMSFLDFINNSDDATFASELGEWLDTEAFATYLAFQDLVQNGDDIDGRGNNSYLHYNYETGTFTVVSWDLNLAFATANVSGGPGGNRGGGPVGGAAGGRPARPEPGQGAVADAPLGGADAGGAPGSGGSNVLASRFLANDTYGAMYDQAVVELTESLFANGEAEAIVSRWVELLAREAGHLVPEATIDADAAAITATFPVV